MRTPVTPDPVGQTLPPRIEGATDKHSDQFSVVLRTSSLLGGERKLGLVRVITSLSNVSARKKKVLDLLPGQ